MRTTIGLVGAAVGAPFTTQPSRSLKQRGHLDRLVVCDIDPHALQGVEADGYYRSIEDMLAEERLNGVAIVTRRKRTCRWPVK